MLWNYLIQYSGLFQNIPVHYLNSIFVFIFNFFIEIQHIFSSQFPPRSHQKTSATRLHVIWFHYWRVLTIIFVYACNLLRLIFYYFHSLHSLQHSLLVVICLWAIIWMNFSQISHQFSWMYVQQTLTEVKEYIELGVCFEQLITGKNEWLWFVVEMYCIFVVIGWNFMWFCRSEWFCAIFENILWLEQLNIRLRKRRIDAQWQNEWRKARNSNAKQWNLKINHKKCWVRSSIAYWLNCSKTLAHSSSQPFIQLFN